MYIPYEKVGKILYSLTKNEKVNKFFFEKKISQNLDFISKNKPRVLKKLKNKLANNKPLNVIFYVYDETKWKCGSVYDLLKKDERFNVKIVVTKPSVKHKNNSNYQTDEEYIKNYEWFKNQGYEVEQGFSVKRGKLIPFKIFNPDIILYQHPWYVGTEQGPVVCSKFALTGYIPYYFPIEAAEIDYNLRFHWYVENYYILDEYTKQKYESKTDKLQGKLKVVGYPYLDYFINNKNENGDYIIYAPHWTITKENLAYGTFTQNGKFILEYAKSHPETKWIFKPHPLLYNELINKNIMTEEEVKAYYNEWDKIGIKYEGGNYLELFNQSKMMITDCSSFLGEYFATGKPLIHILSETTQFRHSDNPILKAYYRVETIEEIEHLLDELPQNDYMAETRRQIAADLNFSNEPSAQKIINSLVSEITA